MPRRALPASVSLVSLVGLAALAALAAPALAAGPPPSPAPAVLPPVPVAGSTAPVPTPAGVRSATSAALDAVPGRVAAIVLDPATGTVLLDRRGSLPSVPASTMKLLTAATALTVLDPASRIATTAVIDGSTVTVVGGGDTTLRVRGGGNPLAGGSASLADLADQVANQVQAGPISLRYDDSAFTGPGRGPGWPSGMPALSALSAVGAGSGNPARAAARALAGLLRARGVAVTDVAPGAAAPGATEIARVESAPVADLVERMLVDSDNLLAESLAHLAGRATGDGASFAGGAAATAAAMRELGIDLGGARIADASGLSSRNAIPPSALATLLALVATGAREGLGPIASGLPVAGVTGTLADRFGRGGQRDAAGYVRAKTGTLRDVTALAGTVEDVDGRVLAFAVLANDVRSVPGARRAVDGFASLLAECGCR